MIKRMPKQKSNSTRPILTKAIPVQSEPAKVEVAKPAPTKLEPARFETPRPAPVQAQPVKPGPVKADQSKAHLELVKPEAKSVFVAGSFNGWNPAKTPLTRVTDGKWVGDLAGISGRHEYLFVVDGQWLPDPNAKESVQNPFGGRNSVLVVSE